MLSRSIGLRTLQRSGYRLVISSLDARRLTLTTVLRARLRGAKRPIVLVVQRRVSFSGRTTLTLRLPRKVRSLVRRGTLLTLRVSVTDATGAATTRSVLVRVR